MSQAYRPLEIAIPDDAILPNGCVFKSLPTLAQLIEFWERCRFPFGIEGVDVGDQVFLREGEWIFGPSKAAVMATLLRWKQTPMSVAFDREGGWDFCNHPAGIAAYDWFSPTTERPALMDPDMDPHEAATVLMERTFDDWAINYVDAQPRSAVSIDAAISDWVSERAAGIPTYGDE